MKNKPIILVHGFLGAGKEWYWGKWKSLPNCFLAHVGPVSSLHDRACELFYQIKGGCVDYGQHHSEAYKHSRFGRTFDGFHPQWDKNNPVHLVGHSFGGLTILYLQYLLQQNYFYGYSTHPDWILSITTIASPLQGVELASFLGVHSFKPKKVVEGSFGAFLIRLVHILSFLLPLINILDLQLDHWGWSYKERSLLLLFIHIIGFCPFRRYGDHAGIDCQPSEVGIWSKKFILNRNTCYTSFVGYNPCFSLERTFVGHLFWLSSYFVKLYTQEENDGLCTRRSQEKLMDVDTTFSSTCVYYYYSSIDEILNKVPSDLRVNGVWNIIECASTTHIDFIPIGNNHYCSSFVNTMSKLHHLIEAEDRKFLNRTDYSLV